MTRYEHEGAVFYSIPEEVVEHHDSRGDMPESWHVAYAADSSGNKLIRIDDGSLWPKRRLMGVRDNPLGPVGYRKEGE